MSVDATQHLLNIFSRLRSADNSDIQSANEELQQICVIPEYLFSLFNIMENAPDKIIQQYSLYNISMCLRNMANSINDIDRLAMKAKIISKIKAENECDLISALIQVIKTIIDVWGFNWPELLDFIFNPSGDASLYSIMGLINIIMNYMEKDAFLNKADFFKSVIAQALVSPKIDENLEAVELLYKIAAILNEVCDFSAFKKPLLSVFLKIIDSGNSNYLASFINPIIYGIDLNVNVFPIDESYQTISQVLLNPQFDYNFRILLHTFLAYLMPHMQCNQEKFINFFNIEKEIAFLCFEEDDDPQFSSLDEVDYILELIFNKLDQFFPESSAKFALNQMNDFLNSNNMNLICFGLLFLRSSIFLHPDAFAPYLDNIISFLIQGFQQRHTIAQRVSARFISTLFDGNDDPLFDIKEEYVIPLKEGIIWYIQDVDFQNGIFLLLILIDHVKNSDIIFDEILPFILQAVTVNHDHILVVANLALQSLISHSLYHVQISFFSLIQSILLIANQPASFTSPQSSIFDSITALAQKVPKKITQFVNQFFPIMLNGLKSKDKIGANEIAINISKLIDLIPEISTFYNSIIEISIKKVNKNWEQILESSPPPKQHSLNKYFLAVTLLECLSKIAIKIQDDNLFLFLFSHLIEISKTFRFTIEQVIKIYNIFSKIIPYYKGNLEQVDILLKYLKRLLKSRNRDVIKCALKALRSYISVFNFERIGFLQEELLKFILYMVEVILKQSTNSSIDWNHIPRETIKIIITILRTINNDEYTLAVYNKIMTNTVNLNVNFLIYSINFTAYMVLTFPQMAQIKQLQEFIYNLIEQFPLSPMNIEVAICQLFISILNSSNTDNINNFITPLISPKIADFFVHLKNRLLSDECAQELSNSIIITFSSFGDIILKEQFPFDEIIPFLLNALQNNEAFNHCNIIYKFLAHNFQFIPDNLKLDTLHLFVRLLSYPYGFLVHSKIKNQILSYLIGLIKANIPQDQNLNSTIRQILGNGMKYHFFNDTVNSILFDMQSQQ